jgi:hypothetical protein
MEQKILEALQIEPFDMTNVLLECAQLLPTLLTDPNRWKSLMINYKPPHLMRIYTNIGNVRINLHYFIPTSEASEVDSSKDGNCNAKPEDYNESSDNYFHPHGWASCMKIMKGHYEQWMGFANQRGLDNPPLKSLHLRHSQGDTYAMNHPWLWHQVIPPENEPVMTMMVTHIPKNWDQDSPKSEISLRELSEQERNFMFQEFLKCVYLNCF